MSNRNKRSRLIEFCSTAIAEMPFQTEDGEDFPVRDYYVCPLCKKTFNLQKLGDKVGDVLTLEDVPPKSLGGSPRIVTASVDMILIIGCCMNWNCDMETRIDKLKSLMRF